MCPDVSDHQPLADLAWIHFLRTMAVSSTASVYIKSYDDSLSGRLGAWPVKKNIFSMHTITKLKQNLILKFKIIFKTSFVFIIAFMVYE